MDAVKSSKKVRSYKDQLIDDTPPSVVAGLTNILDAMPEEYLYEENRKETEESIAAVNSGSEKLGAEFDNMLYDSNMRHLRLPGDMSFYHILQVLLKNRRIAIIIEDAHFCDELSWAELLLILNGKELDVSMLLTMRSNGMKANGGISTSSFASSSGANSFSIHTSNHSQADLNRHTSTNNLAINRPTINTNTNTNGIANLNTADSPTAMAIRERDRETTRSSIHRNSVLVSAITVSRSTSVDVTANSQNNQGKYIAPTGSLSPRNFRPNRSPTHGETDVLASRYGLKSQSPALLSILGHERSTVIEMTGLGESEVREVLLHTLKVEHISHNLVSIVYDVSSGNAYWCKAIANFIKERGVKELEDAIQKGDSPHNALKVLILLRMEKLDVDQQLVLKCAAIIGDEFSERMLLHVLPSRIQSILAESLEQLAEHGFVFCVEEYPEAIFAFQNELIRETLYELIPPRDSANIHLQVAQFIEREYAANLRPFYPILGAHYSKSLGNRGLAFMYQIKAADQAISRGAFSDGLAFLEAAHKVAVTKPELKVLNDVIARALQDMGPISNAKITATVRKVANRSFRHSTNGGNGNGINDPSHGKQQAYLQIQTKIHAQLEKFEQNRQQNQLGKKNPKDVRLTWQPSYVASRMGEISDESDEDTPPAGKKKKKKGGKKTAWCSIS